MTRETLNPAALSVPRGYSHVTVVASPRQVHVSGQVALNAAGELVGKGDIAAQAEQVWVNIGHALAAAGAKLTDVFKMVTYVVGLDADRVAAVRAARNKHLGEGPYPASTMVGVTALVHPDLLVEIEVIAALD